MVLVGMRVEILIFFFFSTEVMRVGEAVKKGAMYQWRLIALSQR